MPSRALLVRLVALAVALGVARPGASSAPVADDEQRGGRAAELADLDDSQRARLETAFDGRDHREAAFAALVENVLGWSFPERPGVPGVELLSGDRATAFLAAPEASRGTLVRVRGRLAQRSTLAAPWGHLEEWFVRLADGTPIAAYVPRDGGSDVSGSVRDGALVEIVGRLYKRIEARARDGGTRSYVAVVGRAIAPGESASARSDAPPDLAMPFALAAIVLGAFVVFIWLRRVASRSDARGRRGPRPLDVGARSDDAA